MNAQTHTVHVIGAGPAGLMAAERLAGAGVKVVVHEAMPSPARKFLMAGRGGLNLTHSEDADAFAGRYAEAQGAVRPWLARFSPTHLVGVDAMRRVLRAVAHRSAVGTGRGAQGS